MIGENNLLTVYITGANGFVGKNLVSYLSTKAAIKIIKISRNDLNSGDLSFDDHSVIIHLAGKAHDLRNVSSPDEYYYVNFELTKRLYNSFINSNANKFIFVSSVKAAADSLSGVLTENYIPIPKTHYGQSKLKAEQYIESMQLKERQSYLILRPCMIHGPGNKGNLSLLYNFVLNGIPYPLSAFDNSRSFLSVENLCFVIDKLLSMEVQSGIYNLADDDAISTNDLIRFLARTLNRRPKLWAVSKSIIKLIAAIGDKIGGPLTTDRVQKLTENYVVSNVKIKKAICSEFPLTTLEGFSITANSFKSGIKS